MEVQNVQEVHNHTNLALQVLINNSKWNFISDHGINIHTKVINIHESFCVCAQPMRNNITIRRLVLTEHTYKMIPEFFMSILSQDIHRSS